jgi:hypothetical protein
MRRQFSNRSFFGRDLSEFHCEGCDERRPVYPPEAKRQDNFAMALQVFSREHALCRKFETVAKAKAALRWTRMMRKSNVPEQERERAIKQGSWAAIVLGRRPKSWVNETSTTTLAGPAVLRD